MGAFVLGQGSGINEVIINGENGYLANGTDIYSLTKALRSAIKSKTKPELLKMLEKQFWKISHWKK